MRVRLLVASLVAAAVGLTGGTARAESETRQTIEELRELMAPASRVDVRCDLSVLATRQIGDGRAGFDVEIGTRPDYWYDLGVATIARTTVTTTTSDVGTRITMSQSADGVGISARLFKRIGPLVLSGGIVDSTGGVGIELRALDDRLRIEALATNWSPSEMRTLPHLRVGGSAQWGFLYVQGGVLDALADPRASAYIGVGLRWRDPDLMSTIAWFRH